MAVVRRVYVYLLAWAGLGMLALGTANVGRVLVAVLDGASIAARDTYVRDEVSRWGALALVGLPVWLLHWVAAQRLAKDPAERSSPLRRLYLYVALAQGAIATTIVLTDVLRGPLAWSGSNLDSLRASAESLPLLVVAVVVWAFHWRAAAQDRAAVGEERASATLRRWYVYGVAYVGFVLLTVSARDLLEDVWRTLAASAPPRPALAGSAAAALAGLVVWLWHWQWAPRAAGANALAQDRTSTLRSVYLFLALALAVWWTLSGASQILYYALARALGVDRPGGVGGNLLEAAAWPGSTLAIFGVAWAYQRAAIRRQAREVEAPRQAGVRRVYTYLVALLGLGALCGGVGWLLWTMVDALVAASPATYATSWWRDRLAQGAMLAIVGLPVWLAHWRTTARITGDEARSLGRRIYVYLALIASMLALLASVAVVVYRLLTLLLGAAPTADVTTDLAHAASVSAVAALVALYHWRTLGADAARGRAEAPRVAETTAGPAEALVRLRASDRVVLVGALDWLRSRGIQVDEVPRS